MEEQSSSYGAGCADTPFCCCSAPSRVGAAPFYYRHNPCWGCSPLLTCLSLLRGGCAGALSCRQSCTGEGGSMQPPPLPNRQDLCNGANVTGKAQLQLRCRNSYVHLAMAAVCGGGSLGVSCRGASRLQPSLAATPAPWSRAQQVKEGLGPPSSPPWVGCIGADLQGMVQCHGAGLDASPAPGLVLGHSTAVLGSSSLLYFRHYSPGTSSLGWVHASPGAASRQC